MTAYRQRRRLRGRIARLDRGARATSGPPFPTPPNILLRNVYGWFARIERGTYGLTRPQPRPHWPLAARAAQPLGQPADVDRRSMVRVVPLRNSGGRAASRSACAVCPWCARRSDPPPRPRRRRPRTPRSGDRGAGHRDLRRRPVPKAYCKPRRPGRRRGRRSDCEPPSPCRKSPASARRPACAPAPNPGRPSRALLSRNVAK